MIITEGIKVTLKGDNTDLNRKLTASEKVWNTYKLAAVGALTAIAVQGTRMAATLDKEIRLVATLTGANTREMELMRKEVMALGKEFGKNFDLIARANYQAVSGGFKGINESMKLTRAGVQLAIATNGDLVKSTEAVVKWLKAFGGGADEATKAAAQLWGITQDGIVTGEQLTRFLSDLPSSFAISGISAQELGGALSTITGQTGNASRAVDQLRSALIQMERQGMTGTLVERTEKFVGKGLGKMVELLKDQTAATGMQILAANLDTFKTNVDSAHNVTDGFNTAMDTMADSAEQKWNVAMQELKAVLAEIGHDLLPFVTAGVSGLADAMRNPPSGGGILGDALTNPGRYDALNRLIAGGSYQPAFSGLAFLGLGGGSRGPGPGYIPPNVPPGTRRRPPFMGPEGLGLGEQQENAGDELRALAQWEASLDELAPKFKHAAEGTLELNRAVQILGPAAFNVAMVFARDLVDALGVTNDALRTFIQSLIETLIEAGFRMALRMAGSIPGDAAGPDGPGGNKTSGFTGPNKGAFLSNSVSNIGSASTASIMRVVNNTSLSASPTINVGGSGATANQIGRSVNAGVTAALREADLTGINRMHKKAGLGG